MFIVMPEANLTEEEALTLALKASMDSAMEEQAARIVSSLFDYVLGTFIVSLTPLISHVNVTLAFMLL